MKQLDIKKYTPSLKLQNCIDAYWSVKNIYTKDVQIPIVPDGCMDIIYQDGKILCIGAMSEAFIVSAKPREYTFGIRFKPSVLPQLLKINASEFTDKKVFLQELSLELFSWLDFQELDEQKKVLKLNDIFEKEFENIELNQSITKAIEFIVDFQGNIQVSKLQEQLHLSSRQIERLFQNYVGYSAKKFCNIVRFFTLFKELIQDKKELSLKAYDYGYCDQAHLNKEFKKFSNFTPTHEIMSVFYNTKN
ncbi:DUF6597 domain-containing transcriptional factor [Sulfurimonas sp.]|uniref:DUF6597 domain-containing transcriptional factor n=1 Tax=Sulfurimonas sp. TaxID=2022749 RepID=UPI003D0B17CF